MHAMSHPSLSAEHWQQHIAAWQASGITQADYCKKHGLVPHTFWYWKKKFSPMPPSSAPAAVPVAPFIPLTIMEAPQADRMPDAAADPRVAAISVHVGCRYRIDLLPGFDPATLRQALAILRE